MRGPTWRGFAGGRTPDSSGHEPRRCRPTAPGTPKEGGWGSAFPSTGLPSGGLLQALPRACITPKRAVLNSQLPRLCQSRNSRCDFHAESVRPRSAGSGESFSVLRRTALHSDFLTYVSHWWQLFWLFLVFWLLKGSPYMHPGAHVRVLGQAQAPVGRLGHQVHKPPGMWYHTVSRNCPPHVSASRTAGLLFAPFPLLRVTVSYLSRFTVGCSFNLYFPYVSKPCAVIGYLEILFCEVPLKSPAHFQLGIFSLLFPRLSLHMKDTSLCQLSLVEVLSPRTRTAFSLPWWCFLTISSFFQHPSYQSSSPQCLLAVFRFSLQHGHQRYSLLDFPRGFWLLPLGFHTDNYDPLGTDFLHTA